MSNALQPRDFVPMPPGVAGLLAHWALRSADDVVLGPNFGSGTFLLESARRLQSLGTTDERLARQLHGSDSRAEAAVNLRQAFRASGLPADLPGVRHGDLFTSPLPPVDVLIGAPPDTRQRDTEILKSAIRGIPEAAGCSRLGDPQCLLVIHAAGFLKPGGRLAVILSDRWLDMQYGTAFKNYLLRTFVVRGVVGFQNGNLDPARTGPVVLLAEKRTGQEAGRTPPVPFVCLRPDTHRHLSADLRTLLEGQSPDVDRSIVPPDDLKPEARWSPFLYAPDVYRALRVQAGLTPMNSLAHVRLGVQTFAKPFYVVPLAALQRWQLERRWLMPMLLSPRHLGTPCLSSEASPRHYLLACRAGKEQLGGTRLLRYIEYWENQVLAPRGRGRPVVGVNNLPRVSRANRRPWYNLLDDLTRRGTAPILLPRRLYRNLWVVWNQAGWVASENFLEITPRAGIQPQALLAVLNASISEIALRVNAHVYGGVYSLNPRSVGEVPVVDLRRLEPQALRRINKAYRQFLRINGSERGRLDAAVFAEAGLPDTLFQDLQATLGRMQSPAAGTPPAAEEEGGLPGELRLL